MSEKMPQRVNRRKRNTLSKEEILNTSLDIIKTYGLSGLHMRTIAEKLSSSVGSIYNYFDNQEEIVKELLFRGENKLTNDILNGLKNQNSPITKLKSIGWAYWNFSIENRDLHRLMFNIGGGMHKKLFSYPKSYKIFLKTVYQYLNSKNNKNIPRNKFNSFARTIWAWMYGILVLKMTGFLDQKTSNNFTPVEDGIELFQKMVEGI
ncbi:MAG: TetR/AcrR family transcriptional regulator [Leptospiraceae bacterium]|nr:TetR/AcrR family transcriptional regulator [Leptospiraceae bacterium]